MTNNAGKSFRKRRYPLDPSSHLIAWIEPVDMRRYPDSGPVTLTFPQMQVLEPADAVKLADWIKAAFSGPVENVILEY